MSPSSDLREFGAAAVDQRAHVLVGRRDHETLVEGSSGAVLGVEDDGAARLGKRTSRVEPAFAGEAADCLRLAGRVIEPEGEGLSDRVGDLRRSRQSARYAQKSA